MPKARPKSIPNRKLQTLHQTPKVHPGAAAAAAAAEEKAKNKPAAKTNVVLDVKGWDDETDLEAMEKGVRAVICRILEPSTFNPQPSTLNSKTYTLNPKPYTLNPEP